MTAPGRITGYSAPGGPGVRVDGCVFAGYLPPLSFDPLLLKVVARSPLVTSPQHMARSGDGGGGGTEGGAEGGAESSAGAAAFDAARRRLLGACGELHLGGTLGTNLAELRRVLAAAPFVRAEWTVAMLDEDITQGRGEGHNQGHDEGHAARAAHTDASAAGGEGGGEGGWSAQLEQRRRGAEALRAEMLERAFGTEVAHSARPGVEQQQQEEGEGLAATEPPPPAGCAWVRAPMQGEVVASAEGAAEGAAVREGSTLLVLQATGACKYSSRIGSVS